ncbi:MAG: hypothetical protein U9O94_02850 [Nanoarchaeota archaeon]|nr:hypothetical protein [Nanoarchaeota archaeon]
MNIPKTITLTTTDWELIETVYDQGAFTFRPNADIQFAKSDNPNPDEIITILTDEKNKFRKATSFYVK